VGPFFVTTESLEYTPDALATLPENVGLVLTGAINALEDIPLSEWNHETIQAALAAALVDDLGLKPRIAYGPLRVAVAGRKVSPPLFESMHILGKAETIARLDKLVKAL